MGRNTKRRAASRKPLKTKKPRVRPAPSADATTLPDLVTLLHLQLVPFLTPRDLSRLLRSLARLVSAELRESLASTGLRRLYERESAHFGQRCSSDWHLLVPTEAEGGEGPCVTCSPDAPKDLPLPRVLNAREHLLEAACLAAEGFGDVCDGVLQMHFGQFASPRLGSMQPVVFSLATALELQQQEDACSTKTRRLKQEGAEADEDIDTDDVAQLTRLMDAVHMGVGTQFFSKRKQNCAPTNAVEAHWRSITVDAKTGETTCGYCQFIAAHASAHRCERCTQVFARLLQQHCSALYQPLKKFMLRHLKHVRYMKPCRGWNCLDDDFQDDDLMDLIAGFTPAGVLCGVYLTDLRIPRSMVRDRLALALLPLGLTSYLAPEDALSLLVHCSPSLSQVVRDAVATQGLKTFYDREEVHLGKGCMRDWHRLVPSRTVASHLDRCSCSRNANPLPNDLPLPRQLNARHHLLEAMCLVYRGIQPHCFQVLQLDRSFERRQYGVLQPVVFSLAAALEEQPSSNSEQKAIDVKDVALLTRLMNRLETDFGSRFFRSSDHRRCPAGVLEAHWTSIHVDLATDTTFCHFCDANTGSMVEGPLNPQFREAEYEFLMRQHCRDVYQPLKKFMARHLQHVRYVRPPRGWNEAGDNFQGNEWLDLIAGFTPGGVLCGVYLTDVRIPRAWINDRLAPGAYPFDESAVDLTRLRIAYE
ncbi:hypothetical protein PHYSODRAFT_304898 [Phytophthora sojae]|uniref:Uncharacterized protein n=1 Tax=Phytophthora sojae (strain P6497) TaxID=1094619 RepID=G5A0S0_PHYSP|nr:hypothetical protein PHYSODRAFT_304898 [Phytophthora sojae]EGZ11406.1 hypothetical protein PHYSODRAFT_304898 [Phytophthora sojae]|eukprot:XP_009534151.1 hypothetical protein PHYSODRAFT_304898 [Phytophthora sojae]